MLADSNDDDGEGPDAQVLEEEDEEQSEYRHIEQALKVVRDMSNKLYKSNMPSGSIDSRKYVRFIAQIHVIKLWFKLGNYK